MLVTFKRLFTHKKSNHKFRETNIVFGFLNQVIYLCNSTSLVVFEQKKNMAKNYVQIEVGTFYDFSLFQTVGAEMQQDQVAATASWAEH